MFLDVVDRIYGQWVRYDGAESDFWAYCIRRTYEMSERTKNENLLEI